MEYFFDGKRLVGITVWGCNDDHQENRYDWTMDFYDVGSLPHAGDYDGSPVYTVDDVQYLIDYADDYVNFAGDFAGQKEEEDPEHIRYRAYDFDDVAIDDKFIKED